MQATTIKRTAARNIGIVAIAATIAVTGALAGQSAEASNPALSVSQASTSIAQSQVRAFAGVGMQGEGLVDAANRAFVERQLRAHLGPGQGEGFVDASAIVDFQVMQRAPLVAYLGLGQGEGLVGPGQTVVEPRIMQKSPVKAYLGSNQGDGLVDTSNAPTPKPLFAYSGVHQGEGLIGPGGGN